MPASKIVDHGEVKKWFEEGKTYAWMVEEYRRKYHIETVPSMWGNYRQRHGLERRSTRNDDLIPWYVKPEHRWKYPVMMLRLEARKRAGKDISEANESRLRVWLAQLADSGTVVHYDPETEEGWFYVAPRKGIDTDLIRVPDRKTTLKRPID